MRRRATRRGRRGGFFRRGGVGRCRGRVLSDRRHLLFLRPGNPSGITGYIAGFLGGTRFSGDAADAQTFFSGSLGGGADVALSQHLSLRLDGRFYTTFTSTSGTIACAPEFCVASVYGNYFAQFVASAGLAVRF